MSETFCIADTHFGHQWVIGFRPQFANWMENDLTIASRWNNKVGKHDTVYLIGDYAFSALGHRMVRLLNGKITLVAGNHDQKKADYYMHLGFHDVVGVKNLRGYWLTHIPMHTQCVDEPRVKGNIHGHLHRNHVMQSLGFVHDDGGHAEKQHPKYFNVSVENIDYEPISFDDIKMLLDRDTA